jgi:hypothetical protein
VVAAWPRPQRQRGDGGGSAVAASAAPRRRWQRRWRPRAAWRWRPAWQLGNSAASLAAAPRWDARLAVAAAAAGSASAARWRQAWPRQQQGSVPDSFCTLVCTMRRGWRSSRPSGNDNGGAMKATTMASHWPPRPPRMTEAAGVPLQRSEGLKKLCYNQHVVWGGVWKGAGVNGATAAATVDVVGRALAATTRAGIGPDVA